MQNRQNITLKIDEYNGKVLIIQDHGSLHVPYTTLTVCVPVAAGITLTKEFEYKEAPRNEWP